MENQTTKELSVYEPEKDAQVATIVLNGYNIAAGGPLGRNGALKSFKIINGDLTEAWEQQAVLMLRAQEGREARIRVAALPVEKGSFGLIEFV